MSKKNKSNNNNKSKIIFTDTKTNNISVSIVTITQKSRFQSLTILLDLIQEQTYKNIKEWIIVEGSKNFTDIEQNKINISGMINDKQSQVNFKIKYIEKQNNCKLGELRNIGNKNCSGDITVCMDDDDYYPPNRIEHAVTKLSESNCKIAGCSNHYIYDYNLNILVQMKIFGKYHSPNSCMAWKKEYLETNSHDNTKDFAEEASFTNNFTTPMVQLDPESSIIMSSHNLNTFSKKKLFISIVNNIDSAVDKIISKPIKSLIPEKYFNKYNQIFNQNKTNNDCIYDIVYMCGTFSINWDPSDKKLGESERSVVYLSESWAKLGKKVIVYGEIPEMILNGVEYKPYHHFDYNIKYKNLILWRLYGLITVLPFDIKADFIGFDIHDNFFNQVKENYIKYNKYADKIFVKSNYHKNCFLKYIDSNYDKNKIIVIENGINTEKILNYHNLINDKSINRNPYRFCYFSSNIKALDIIISKVWSIIYNYEPRAELHVYSNINNANNDEYKNYLQLILSQPGIMYHDKQTDDLIIRENYMSTFNLYLTNTKSEIDCINIKESLLANCIPIISNSGVFKDLYGIHFDFEDDKQIQMASINIINLLKNPNKLENYKKEIDFSKINNNEKVASYWIKFMN